ncbi:MAG: SLATT domain-containing protein, partial [Bacteroidota bacterium]
MENLEKYLDEKLNSSIGEFKSRRKRMFKVVKNFKYPTVILAAMSTIVLGLELGTSTIVYQKNIALVIGAIITGLTTMMTFWNVEEYWLKSKVIELQLISLKNSFEFEKRAGIDENRLK